MNKNSYAVRVLVNGRPVQEFEKDNRVYIEGRIGSQYTVEVKNNSSLRMMAVVTIDGVNVITGKPSNEKDHSGYIVNGNSSTVIDGFRKDMENVGKFKFCQKSKSYCNEKGLDGNNGVLGVRIYCEDITYALNEALKNLPNTTPYIPHVPWKPNNPWHPTSRPIWYYQDKITSTGVKETPNVYTCSTHNNTPINLGMGEVNTSCMRGVEQPPEDASFSVGTTWGEQKHSPVEYVEFQVGSLLQEFLIYYASMKDLQKLGVPIKKKPQVVYPKAFGSFAEPPKGWRG